MSHEIRTPMNGVLGMLLLALGTELSPEQREFLAAAQGSAEGLLAILNDILDLSKIEAGKLDIERIGFPVEAMLRRSLEVTALRAHAKNLELVVSISRDVPRAIVADALRLGQVLTNLLGNAVKFTERGQVLLSLSVVHEQEPLLRLSVEDSGVGISKERQELIFDPFQQADNSITRRFGGTGLGLTICKELVSLMGGALSVRSELGQGSTFTVTLPLVVSGPLDAEPPLALAIENRCVLIVEDHPLARESLAAMLTREGIRVLSASTASEAYALVLGEAVVHAALIDHGLGMQDGLELPRVLKRYDACRHTRFVLLRSRERPGRHALDRSGYELALDKPVLASDLQRALTAPTMQTPITNQHASLPAAHAATAARHGSRRCSSMRAGANSRSRCRRCSRAYGTRRSACGPRSATSADREQVDARQTAPTRSSRRAQRTIEHARRVVSGLARGGGTRSTVKVRTVLALSLLTSTLAPRGHACGAYLTRVRSGLSRRSCSPAKATGFDTASVPGTASGALRTSGWEVRSRGGAEPSHQRRPPADQHSRWGRVLSVGRARRRA